MFEQYALRYAPQPMRHSLRYACCGSSIGIASFSILVPQYNDSLNRMFPATTDKFKPKMFWWPVEDTESRMKAFDKLIEVLEDKQHNKLNL